MLDIYFFFFGDNSFVQQCFSNKLSIVTQKSGKIYVAILE